MVTIPLDVNSLPPIAIVIFIVVFIIAWIIRDLLKGPGVKLGDGYYPRGVKFFEAGTWECSNCGRLKFGESVADPNDERKIWAYARYKGGKESGCNHVWNKISDFVDKKSSEGAKNQPEMDKLWKATKDALAREAAWKAGSAARKAAGGPP